MTSALLDIGAASPAPAPARCPLCGGPIKAKRCRPCQKDTPAPGGPAWHRWTRGIDRVLRARLDAAGLDRLWAATLEGVLGDEPIPPEVAPLVQDLVRLPCSPRRYQARLNRAITRSHIETHLLRQGLRGTARDPHRADNIAGRAADLIWTQRERVAAGEVFERQHDAELVERAVLEDEAREQLRGRRLRGEQLERAVAQVVERAMADVRGRHGRPSDERPRDVRVAVEGLRIAVEDLRVEDLRVEDGDAEEEAAEVESAEPAQMGASR